MKKFRYTGIIYNDLEWYKYKDIQNRINIMMCSSAKNNLETYNNSKINLSYEVAILLNNELDQRIYKYNTLNEATTAVYFINLLIQKEGYAEDTSNYIEKQNYQGIVDYKVFTSVKDGKGKEIISDVTDNFHYWKSLESDIKDKEIKEQKEELELYRNYLKQFNIDIDTIKKHNEKLKKEAI